MIAISSGLNKAARSIANECMTFHLALLSKHLSLIPPEKKVDPFGRTYSWYELQEYKNRIDYIISDIGDIAMASRGKGKNAASKRQEYSFVRCELQAEDKKAAKVWMQENATEFGALLHDVMASGYKFSCSFSKDYDTFTASLTGKADESVNEYKTLTARHKDWVDAAMTVLYKHCVMFRSGVWEADDDDDDDGWA